MAYNPYLPIGYNNYPQSIPQQQIIPTPATQQNQNTSLIWVQGEAGAKSYLVAPNSTVMLMDSESERFFLTSADASGMPAPLRIFEFKEVTGSAQATPPTNTPEYVTKEEFDEFKAELMKDRKQSPQRKGRQDEHTV